MSILIKGMEMPPTCEQCPFCDYEEAHCLVFDIPTSKNRYDKREAWCPIVEVPPHGRLIDADVLRHSHCVECTLFPDNCLGDECDWGSIYHIDHAKTIIEAEVDDG